VLFAACYWPDEPEQDTERLGSFLAAFTLRGGLKWETYLGDADFDQLEVTAGGHVVLTGTPALEQGSGGVICFVRNRGWLAWQQSSAGLGCPGGQILELSVDYSGQLMCLAYPDTGVEQCRTGTGLFLGENGELLGSIPLESFSPCTPYSTKVDCQWVGGNALYYVHEHHSFDLDILLGFDYDARLLCLAPFEKIGNWVMAGDDSLYVHTRGGWLHRLTPAGKELWRRGVELDHFLNDLTWSPAGYLLARDASAGLVALNAGGRVLWRYGSAGQSVFGPLTLGPAGRIYLRMTEHHNAGVDLTGGGEAGADETSYVVALDPRGEERWRYALPDNLWGAGPLLPDDAGGLVLVLRFDRGADAEAVMLTPDGEAQTTLEQYKPDQVLLAPTGELCMVSEGSVVVYSSSGVELWQRQLLDPERFYVGRPRIAIGPENTLYAYYNTSVDSG
jgi:outer membrane protein assembly factor BamB